MTPLDFSVPNLTAPIELDAQLALVPAGATVKGMMLHSICEHLKHRNIPVPDEFGRYIGFKDYPGEEFVRLLAFAAHEISPDDALGEGLRALGRLAYPTLLDSLIGRVLFSLVSREIRRVLPLAARAYKASASTGTAYVELMGDSAAIVTLENIYTFLETYHFGVIEGTLIACGLEGEVHFKPLSETSGAFFVQWHGG